MWSPLEESIVPERVGSNVAGPWDRRGALRHSVLPPLQNLGKDRDGLHATVELMQVRVHSLMHMLTLQEEELVRKVGPSWGSPWPLLLRQDREKLNGTSFLCCPRSPHFLPFSDSTF